MIYYRKTLFGCGPKLTAVQFSTTKALAIESDGYLVKKELLPKANKVVADTLGISAKQWRSEQLSSFKKFYKGDAEIMFDATNGDVTDSYGIYFIQNKIK